jgi:hypothetical protein
MGPVDRAWPPLPYPSPCTARPWHARHAPTPSSDAATTECIPRHHATRMHALQFARDDMEREAITRREARNPPADHFELAEYFLNTLGPVRVRVCVCVLGGGVVCEP